MLPAGFVRYVASLAVAAFIAAWLAVGLSGCGGGGGGVTPSTGGGSSMLPPSSIPVSGAGSAPAPGSNIPGGAGNALPLTGPPYGPSASGNAWGPPSLAAALNYPVQSGYDGTGITVAVLIDSSLDVAGDLAPYLAYFQIPKSPGRTFPSVAIDGASMVPDGNGGGALEATLDVETIAGLAPGATIVTYVIPSLTVQSEIDALNTIVSGAKAQIVTMSFGGCERPSGARMGENVVFAQGVKAGITFIASSGDQGSACPNGQDSTGQAIFASGVQYPASDPNVIGVGGTETERTANLLTSTTAWNDFFTADRKGEASGGGVSALFTAPSYQRGLSGIASAKFRNVPDIAMPAVYDAIYKRGWHIVNGTSWGAPAFGAMLAEIYQYCQGGWTNAAALPYQVLGKAGYTAFIDATAGSNQYGAYMPYFAAAPGYDNATGIGVPRGMPFADAICPGSVRGAALQAAQTDAAAIQAAQNLALSTDLTPHVNGLRDLGPRAPSDRTRIQVVLIPTASLQSDEQSVRDALGAAGFTIVATFSNHLVVDAEGPASAVERFFATQMHDVDQGRYGTRYLAAAPVTVPAALAPHIASVTLDSVVTESDSHEHS